jgi:hypothetical protein
VIGLESDGSFTLGMSLFAEEEGNSVALMELSNPEIDLEGEVMVSVLGSILLIHSSPMACS